jgi:hypothetical protein
MSLEHGCGKEEAIVKEGGARRLLMVADVLTDAAAGERCACR